MTNDIKIEFTRGGYEIKEINELVTIKKVYIAECGLSVLKSKCTNWVDEVPPSVIKANVSRLDMLSIGKYVNRV